MQCHYQLFHVIFIFRCGGIASTWLSKDFGVETWNILNRLHIKTLRKPESIWKPTMTVAVPEANVACIGMLLCSIQGRLRMRLKKKKKKTDGGKHYRTNGSALKSMLLSSREKVHFTITGSVIPFSLQSALSITNFQINEPSLIPWVQVLSCLWLSEQIFCLLQFCAIKSRQNFSD